MAESVIAENVFGTISLILWSVQLLPQIWLNYKRKSTAGMSLEMMVLWYVGSILLNPYYLFIGINIPLIIQAHCFSLLSMTCVLQHYYYDGVTRPFARKHPPADDEQRPRHVVASGVCFLLLGANWIGIEIGILKALELTHSEVLKGFCAFIPVAFGILGVLLQVIACLRHKSTEGLSLIFLWLDFCGAIMGIFSLFFKSGPFDFQAAGIFIAVACGNTVLLVMDAYFRRTSKSKLRHSESEISLEETESTIEPSETAISVH